MQKRFVSIWFRYLKTDWHCRRQPSLKKVPFVLTSPDHGRMIITGANVQAQTQGVDTGMAVADARVMILSLEAADDDAALAQRLLNNLARWFIRYSPVVSIDLPDGLILDATGCAHLWGGEKQYITEIHRRLHEFGYHTQIAMADTIGAAWAVARFGKQVTVIEMTKQQEALLNLPPAALRLEADTVERLEKLGLRQISSFISMPSTSLRRRFGQHFIKRLHHAIGTEEEIREPVMPVMSYHERLPCLEPIVTAKGIEIALQQLLEILCNRLRQEGKGLRKVVLNCYRIDSKIETIETGTNRPSHNFKHIYKLLEIKIDTIEPALGIELFTLEALKVEDLSPSQAKLWEAIGGLDDNNLSELLDRIDGKMGTGHIYRYLPDEHYWPERSFKPATELNEAPAAPWKVTVPRPLKMLGKPEPIEVTAPIPDYPPMTFRYQGTLHKVIKADGPERIEQEWWLQQGQHRDYYTVEDEEGCRYWLFRSGHYDSERSYQWFIHGFFA